MLGSLCDGWRRRRAHGVIDNVLWHGKRPRPPKADESPTPAHPRMGRHNATLSDIAPVRRALRRTGRNVR